MYKHIISCLLIIVGYNTSIVSMDFQKIITKIEKGQSLCDKASGFPAYMINPTFCEQLGAGKEKIAEIENAYKVLTPEQKKEARKTVSNIVQTSQFKELKVPDITCKYDSKIKARRCSMSGDQYDQLVRNSAAINVQLATQLNNCTVDPKNSVNECLAISLYTGKKLEKEWHKLQQ